MFENSRENINKFFIENSKFWIVWWICTTFDNLTIILQCFFDFGELGKIFEILRTICTITIIVVCFYSIVKTFTYDRINLKRKFDVLRYIVYKNNKY